MVNRRGYCTPCHNAYMREWRKTHRLQGEARKKMVARAYANVYLNRGKIERKPCEVCGGRAQMHHEDYSKPLEVRWLCRHHHMQEHKRDEIRIVAAA